MDRGRKKPLDRLRDACYEDNTAELEKPMSRAAIVTVFLAAAVPAVAALQPTPAAPVEAPAPFVAADANAAVEALATALEENFVFPDKGKAYAMVLRSKLASGGYASFANAEEFAKAVTADLQAVHKDGHLRLHAPRPAGTEGPQRMRRGPGPESAIRKAGWIADGVAYIDFAGFPGNDATLAQLRSFLAEHSLAKTLIIDARGHGGGGLAEMDVMFPYFYHKPQALVQMDTRIAVEQRNGSPLHDTPSLQKVKGPDEVIRRTHSVIPSAQATALRKAKIFLLTSNRTASAAEHLSLSLKRTGRATLIGEITRGAGHYGGMIPMGGGYAAFIPVGAHLRSGDQRGAGKGRG
jgi:hypothetical protein